MSSSTTPTTTSSSTETSTPTTNNNAPAGGAPTPTGDTPAPNNGVPTGGGTNTTLQPGPTTQDPTTSPAATQVPSANNGTAAQPAGTQSQDSKDEYGGKEGEDLYTEIAKLAPFGEIRPVYTESGDLIKVGCYAVDKLNISKEGTIYLKYGADVPSIKIDQGLTDFGINATILARDINNSLTPLIKHQLNYYFVICFMTLYNDNGTGNNDSIIYQPYIFEIDAIKLSEDKSNEKIYKIVLSDLLSATLKKVSYGNMLLQYPELPNVANFGDLYNYFIEYASTIINVVHNKKYKIPNKIIFKSLNSDSINALIKGVIFKDLPIDTNALTLLQRIFRIAARELEAPANFAAKAEIKGTILTPLFLTEEWEDFSAAYRSFYETDTEIKLDSTLTYEGSERCGGVYLRRALFMKHLQMPFQLAFDTDKDPQIFEVINPNYAGGKVSADDQFFNPMNGYMNTPINNIIELPIDGATVGLGWRNLMLMADTAGGGSNSLIYFNWIYEYYKHAYLNYEECKLAAKLKKHLIPVMDPNFHIAEVHGLTGGDAEFFAKANSSVIKLRSEDILKEAFLHVGRQVKSYIFMNALTGFKLNASIVRHPGEIIKINNPAKESETASMQPVVGGIDAQEFGYVLLYVTHISHILSGSKFENVIYGTRICDISEPLKDPIVEETDTSQQNNSAGTTTPGTTTPGTTTSGTTTPGTTTPGTTTPGTTTPGTTTPGTTTPGTTTPGTT